MEEAPEAVVEGEVLPLDHEEEEVVDQGVEEEVEEAAGFLGGFPWRRAGGGAYVRGEQRNSFRVDGTNANPNLFDIGRADRVCKWCKAKKWAGETEGLCCKKGKVNLPPFPDPPEPLFSLYNRTHPKHNEFFDHIRIYNSLFQLASSSATPPADIAPDVTVFNFTICGRVHHRMGPLLPPQSQQPKFAQIYMLDPAEQHKARQEIFHPDPNSQVYSLQGAIEECLWAVNRYIQRFVPLGKQDPNLPVYNAVLQVHGAPKRFDAPTAHEIAAFIPEGVVSPSHSKREILVSHSS